MSMILSALALGILAWVLVVRPWRKPRIGTLPVAVAVMFGLSGYLLMGRPGLASSPHRPPASQRDFGEELRDPRGGMTDRFGDAAQWLAASDGMMRSGDTLAAAQFLQQGVSVHPDSVDMWIGFGNALVAHAGGVMTPAAAAAFDKAAAISPNHPGPPFFAGLALAQSGDIEGARAVWNELLRRTPADAPWRADLSNRLAALPPAPPPAAAPAPPQATPQTGQNPPNPRTP
ncbi:MAG: cytochrome c biogenesis factor [Sphingomonadaceae bacterium]|nr:cytochrome c biogenesis factor [Sphingomonadaceae bacterium]